MITFILLALSFKLEDNHQIYGEFVFVIIELLMEKQLDLINKVAI